MSRTSRQFARRTLEFRDGRLKKDRLVENRQIAREVLKTLPTAEEQAAADAAEDAAEIVRGDGKT